MRDCGWGGGPSMGNDCRSIRSSVLNWLPIRHDSYYSVRLSSNLFFPDGRCRLTVHTVPPLFLDPAAPLADHVWKRVAVFLLLHAFQSMVVNCSVLPLSCPPPCLLPRWGKSRLRGAQSQVQGCVFGSRGVSRKFDFSSVVVPFGTIDDQCWMTLYFLVCLSLSSVANVWHNSEKFALWLFWGGGVSWHSRPFWTLLWTSPLYLTWFYMTASLCLSQLMLTKILKCAHSWECKECTYLLSARYARNMSNQIQIGAFKKRLIPKIFLLVSRFNVNILT